MRSKRPRLGPQLLAHCREPGFFDQVHVLFGGTGAVGGATALHLVGLFEEAAVRAGRTPGDDPPRIVVTAREKAEIRQFTRLLFRLQQRDHGGLPERLDGRGYRTCGGVLVELTTLSVDPAIPGLTDLERLDRDGRKAALEGFLAEGGLDLASPAEAKLAYLEECLKERVGRPFSRFLERHRDQHGPPGDRSRFDSVTVTIPLASLAAYKLGSLEEAVRRIGLTDAAAIGELKDLYLRAIRDDLANVAEALADEVLVAHTTAVGGMYDEEEDGRRTIRLGFAHDPLDQRLADKQIFAERLADLYAERRIKMLVTAAAIGVDAVLVRESPPLKRSIRSLLRAAASEGHGVVPDKDLSARVQIYPPCDLDLLAEKPAPLAFDHGRPLVLDYVLKSGENGYFTVSNTDALYRVMRVATSSELGLVLARTALFGDDRHRPIFPDCVCYYTETDNSRQVFDLLGQPQLRRNQLSGLQPKALQDLGSAKHQAELHLLGLLILLHRLRTLNLEAIPPHVNLASFNPQEYFETHSSPPTLDVAAAWQPEELAVDLRQLVTARSEADLAPLKHFFQADPERQEAAHRVFNEVLHGVWAVPSLGTPVLYERDGRRRVVAGFYAAPIDRVLVRRDSLARHLAGRFEELGGGDEAAFDRFVEYQIAANGFADVRPLAVLVGTPPEGTAPSDAVQVFEEEGEFLAALDRLEPYSYFTASGLIATLVRLRAARRMAQEFDPSVGTANEFRAHVPRDDQGRALLYPGVLEAFRMVSEGLEKNTGSERLDGRWGYIPLTH